MGDGWTVCDTVSFSGIVRRAWLSQWPHLFGWPLGFALMYKN